MPYPARGDFQIKGLQPDFWPDKNQLVNAGMADVSMNLIWASWEATPKSPPCNPSSEQEYEGHCFKIDKAVDEAIKDWTDKGVIVAAIIYGVPAWARKGNTGCSPVTDGFDIFCTPDDPDDYARFAGMLAERYNGRNGHGRIADFVIHNEVNSNTWFDIGCGQGVPCAKDKWIKTYADNYAAAYDQIKKHQSAAKVLFSFEHHFDTVFDKPNDKDATLSVKTFVRGLAKLLGDRQWMLAYHPYAPDLLSPDFSVNDLPKVTYGNIGVLLGWLRQEFPDKPHAWEVELTESGVNSAPPKSDETRQAKAICDGFRNILGTPGIINYIYHRLRDNPAEGGLQLGLIRSDDSFKPSWDVWSKCSQQGSLDCGFENLPYTKLTRYHKTFAGHWTSTRLPPDGFDAEQSWFLFRHEQPGTKLLFECKVYTNNLLTDDPNCEGQQNMGPVGYIWTKEHDNTVPLYRCKVGQSGLDHFVSTDPNCEGQIQESLLGYAIPTN
ncbi:MAG: hypothetical protein GXP49_05775 [Deltaproteobacteria bacterium]|nr:hypothetical protein [Deltaproteobacteria bacterium]